MSAAITRLNCSRGLNTSLAAKKVKKKGLVDVNHTKIMYYEPFQKDFYPPVLEVEEMDREYVDLLCLALDGIKIQGLDCPKPVRLA